MALFFAGTTLIKVVPEYYTAQLMGQTRGGDQLRDKKHYACSPQHNVNREKILQGAGAILRPLDYKFDTLMTRLRIQPADMQNFSQAFNVRYTKLYLLHIHSQIT